MSAGCSVGSIRLETKTMNEAMVRFIAQQSGFMNLLFLEGRKSLYIEGLSLVTSWYLED